MSNFRSELHVLCEEGRWDDVRALLTLVVEADEVAAAAEAAEREGGRGCVAAAPRARREEGGGERGEEGDDDDDGPPPSGTSPRSPPASKKRPPKLHFHDSSLALTATTAPPSTAARSASGDALGRSDREAEAAEDDDDAGLAASFPPSESHRDSLYAPSAPRSAYAISTTHSHYEHHPAVSDASSDADSLEEDLRCSYEHLFLGGPRSRSDDDVGELGGIGARDPEEEEDSELQAELRRRDIAALEESVRRDDSGIFGGGAGRRDGGDTEAPAEAEADAEADAEAAATDQHATDEAILMSELTPEELARASILKESLLSREGPDAWTPLMIASARAPPSIVQLLIKARPEACSIPDRSGSLPLHLVARRRRARALSPDAKEGERGGMEGSEIRFPSSRSPIGESQHTAATRQSGRSGPSDLQTSDRSAGGGEEIDQRGKVDELCLAMHLLMTSHPDALATRNRRGQTPLHSLFEADRSGSEEGGGGSSRSSSEASRAVETLLGAWAKIEETVDGSYRSASVIGGLVSAVGPRLRKLFDSCATTPPPPASGGDPMTAAAEAARKLEEVKRAVRSGVRRALRARDARGRLPLHRAASCPWADEGVLRAVAEAFPAAGYVPVLPPSDAGKASVRSSFKSSGKSSAATSWDVDRDAVIPEGSAKNDGDEDDLDYDDGADGLFPRTGGCHGRDLAVHLLHRRLMSPRLRSSLRSRDGELSSRGSSPEDASAFLTDRHRGAIEALLEPLCDAAGRADGLEARQACAATGASERRRRGGRGGPVRRRPRDGPAPPLDGDGASPEPCCLLPLHVAALHGASRPTLRALCRAHPEGARTPLRSSLHPDRIGALPIELFEEGRAGREVNAARTDDEFVRLSADYFRRSDLLFSYHPEATSARNGARYCADEARLGRFERLIRDEAANPDGDGTLSDPAGAVWLFFCRNAGTAPEAEADDGARRRRKASSRSGASAIPDFSAVVGRILSDVPSRAIPRLHLLRTPSVPEGVRVPTLPNGRTVQEEARHRAPRGSLGEAMRERFFPSEVLGFLEAADAAAYSATCRKAYATGVRMLPVVRSGGGKEDAGVETMDVHGSWKFSEGWCGSESSSMLEERGGRVSAPWQKLELPCVPGCTHTVFLECDVTYRSWGNDEDNDGNIRPAAGGEESCSLGLDGGGLLVLSEDSSKNGGQPDLVVASTPVKPIADDSDETGTSRHGRIEATRIRLFFRHLTSRSYTLWYYASERHTLEVANLQLRQLVHSCDYNGHNPLHVLLCEGDNPRNLRRQFDVLIAAGYGHDLPVHHALKVGVLERTLRFLIDARPAALLDADDGRRTPLHAAFDRGAPPGLGVVRALLAGQGENAAHLKDSRGKLPIHLAAEHGGAAESALKALVDAYADGCYRRTDDGDLPLHLLLRSGSATRATVELLIQPIIHNATICAYPGSLGVNLPLHIAAEYRCRYDIFEGLLSSYPEAACVKRQIILPPPSQPKDDSRQKNQPKKDDRFALEIFEGGRNAMQLQNGRAAMKKAGDPNVRRGSATQISPEEADFNKRSDLIFVHNPNVPKCTRPYLTTYFRDEKDRIGRLANLIKKEASQYSRKRRRNSRNIIVEVGSEEEDADLSDMARFAWCWMCTNDHYAEVVSEVVSTLPVDAVKFLVLTKNPKSEPVSDTPIKDCSSPRCTLVMKSRLSFLGRYVPDHTSSPIYKSESCVILRAKDIGAMESYLSIQTLFSDAEPDIDDYSHNCGSVHAITGNSIEVDRFTHFARKIGVGEQQALEQIQQLLLESSSGTSSPRESDRITNLKESGVKKSAFAEFCKLHGIDGTGCRNVAIKFMKSKQCYELEKQCRDILSTSSSSSHHVVPILNHFSFEGDGRNSSDFMKDPFGEDAQPLMDLSSLKYGIVMPMAQGDLRDIFYREGISSSNLRDNARQVGETLRALHEEGITHMNLQMKNVLRFGMEMVLSDFGNALFLKSIEGINAIGGTATKLCPSILPPEMFARIELANRDSFDQLMRYWKYVHGDANQLRSLTPHERQAISQFVQSRISSKLSKPDEQNEGHQQWKENISSLLDTIRFEDLPYALSNCPSFRQFCAIWERLCQNYELWETAVRPWVDEEAQCVYLLKTFENRPNHPSRDVSLLPYKLVPPSEKVDVWIFGIFIYELCSGGNPLHTGYRGDLRGVEAYSKLHRWDLSTAERSVREHVQDPLAQDLLCQILVPAKERLPTMDAVLKHPFFWPKSVEAERFLEKYEEMQLVRDNTVTVRKVTKAVKRMLDDSMEKYCKMAFATDQVAFPTCLVVLPYGLNIDESIGRPIAAANPRLISCAVRLGKCLLDINKATARLSFWLMMSGKMRGGDGDRFKNQMQEWLKRARYESCYSIAMEIVNGLGCGMHYVRICEEVLAFDGNISQAKSYMRDPIRAARRAIKKSSDELAHLYQSQAYLYLVDETTLIPHCLSRKDQVNSYPMELENNPRLLANVLLPFMNIVAMKALAKNHLDGLAILLGLPPSMGIPDSWRPSEPGLLHSANDCASIEDFVILQKILRKDTLNAFVDDASISSKISQSYRSVASGFDNKSILSLSALGLCDVDLSPGDPVVASVPMTQLELLFRERDPDREFGKLRRITSGNSLSKTKRPGLWTNVDTVRLLKSMVEIAEVEEQLREIKVSLDKTNSAAAQYNKLLNRRESLKKSIPNNINFPLKQRPSLLDNSLDDLPPEQGDDYQGYSEEAKYSRSSFVEQPRDQQPQDERDAPPKQDPEPKLEIVTHRMPEPPPQPTQPAQQPEPAHIPHHSHRADPDPEGMKDEKKKKMRKSKRKFRPWFTAC